MANKAGNLTLWINSFKKEDKHPDYRGKLDINGEAYDVAVWVNNERGGIVLHMSGQISTPADDVPAGTDAGRSSSNQTNKDIPF